MSMGKMSGPQPMGRSERMVLAREIADRALAAFGSEVKAVGLYGSMARGDEGPYSDIEMYVILDRPGAEFSHEWAYGDWKAEVDFYGEEVLLAMAAEVEGRWSLTHGSVHHVRPLYDPEGFFPRLRAVAEGRTPEQFRSAISEVLVGELYEFIGKVRNAPHKGTQGSLPELAVQMAKYGAFVIGLQNRHLYSTGARVLVEALELAGRPAGFDELCELVLAGRLSDAAEVAGACERFWSGLVEWAAEHDYPIDAAQRIPF